MTWLLHFPTSFLLKCWKIAWVLEPLQPIWDTGKISGCLLWSDSTPGIAEIWGVNRQMDNSPSPSLSLSLSLSTPFLPPSIFTNLTFNTKKVNLKMKAMTLVIRKKSYTTAIYIHIHQCHLMEKLWEFWHKLPPVMAHFLFLCRIDKQVQHKHLSKHCQSFAQMVGSLYSINANCQEKVTADLWSLYCLFSNLSLLYLDI